MRSNNNFVISVTDRKRKFYNPREKEIFLRFMAELRKNKDVKKETFVIWCMKRYNMDTTTAKRIFNEHTVMCRYCMRVIAREVFHECFK